jgi:hypothetical protein
MSTLFVVTTKTVHRKKAMTPLLIFNLAVQDHLVALRAVEHKDDAALMVGCAHMPRHED